MSGGPVRGHRPPRTFRVYPPVRRSSSILLAIAASLSMLVATVAARPRGEQPLSGATRFVASDGHRERGTGVAGPVTRETAHLPGSRAFGDGPVEFFAAAGASNQLRQRYWISETDDTASGRAPELRSLDRAGLRTHLTAAAGPTANPLTAWQVFTPGLLELPANPAPGMQFESTGTVSTQTTQAAYTDRAEITDAAEFGADCLRVDHRLSVRGRADERRISVRCPGRGVVAVEGRWQAVADHALARWIPAGSATPSLAEVVPNRLPIQRGGSVLAISPVGLARTAEDSLWVGNRSTGNVIRLRREAAAYVPELTIHPGGDLTMVTGCGSAVIAGTTARRLVAHDAAGHWLWTSELPDVAHPSPGRIGDQLLVATLDGALHAVSCRDGRILWSRAGAGSAVTPVAAVGPRGAEVISAAGRTVRLIGADGAQIWEREAPDPVGRVTVADDVVVVADTEGRLQGLDRATGRLQWSTRFAATAEDLQLLGDVLIVRTATGLDGVRLGSGERLWRRDLASVLSAGDGGRVLVIGQQEARSVTADGQLGSSQPVPGPGNSSQIFGLDALGIVVVDAEGVTVWQRP